MNRDENDIDFDDIDDIDFNTFEQEDKKANFINKRKPITKGTEDEKTYRPGLKFTQNKKKEFLKFKNSLGATTNNGILYKLIELGLKKHKKELKRIKKTFKKG